MKATPLYSLYQEALKDGIACHYCKSFYTEPLALHNSERGRGKEKSREKGEGKEARDKAVNGREE